MRREGATGPSVVGEEHGGSICGTPITEGREINRHHGLQLRKGLPARPESQGLPLRRLLGKEHPGRPRGGWAAGRGPAPREPGAEGPAGRSPVGLVAQAVQQARLVQVPREAVQHPPSVHAVVLAQALVQHLQDEAVGD